MSRTFKERIQHGLRSAGIYHRLKGSRLYDWYWRVADPSVLHKRDEEIGFYRGALTGLRPGDLVFDIGANQGFKTDMFLRLGARVVAVDPDESNQAILREKFLRDRFTPRPVTIVGQALSDRVGFETMWVNEPGSAKNTLNTKWVETLGADAERFGEKLGFTGKKQVPITTFEELFRQHGVPAYIKIDVEGYEATVMKGLQSPVPLLSFEVNLPEFRPEARECIAMLAAIDPRGEWNFIADCAGGFKLSQWAGRAEMEAKLEACELPTIEIFWKSPAGLDRVRGGAK